MYLNYCHVLLVSETTQTSTTRSIVFFFFSDHLLTHMIAHLRNSMSLVMGSVGPFKADGPDLRVAPSNAHMADVSRRLDRSLDSRLLVFLSWAPFQGLLLPLSVLEKLCIFNQKDSPDRTLLRKGRPGVEVDVAFLESLLRQHLSIF
ncbi:uncharacterized protein LOC119962456 isoform X2 [Scyliorhinus canicula]|uniref:uncharacterized protein LOC119962456 isoform X2 n=1 Tax=Scyliorhinus canicula TaxID=7830 RepID=UPI0018F57515|nr:uncharacterized protein LOC119962456 isoform X2 [Scyliorhinus canicula]